MKDERFILRQFRGWFIIEREVPDTDFDPPIWIKAEEIARVRSRSEASAVMRSRRGLEPSHD